MDVSDIAADVKARWHAHLFTLRVTEAKRVRQSHFPHSSVFPPIDPSRIGCMSSWWQQAANALHAAGAAASEAAAEQQRLHQALNATGAEICKLQRQVLQVSMYAACFSHPCR